MQTIGIAELKAHLSRELRRVAEGHSVTILDHKRPVAMIIPIARDLELVRPARRIFDLPRAESLIDEDAVRLLERERADR